MPNYKPIKIIFNLDDEFQAELYEYLTKRSNKSSYIRMLLHNDLNGKVIVKPPAQSAPEIIDEDETKSDTKSTSIKTIVQHPVKIKINKTPIVNEPEDEDVILEGLF